jgi:hypothetical protein
MLENKPEVAPSGKLPYHAPQLSVFGDIKTMTQVKALSQLGDNPGMSNAMSAN